MIPQKFPRNSGLMSLVFKPIGFSTGVAILLGNSSAFALNPSQVTTISPDLLSHNITLARDVVVDTKPQESQPTSATEASQAPRFTCQLINGQYTVMYHPQSQQNQSYPWATPSSLGGGWSAERRCNEISRRLEFYRPDGLLEMRNAVENNYNIVCVTTQKDSSCRIVLTVPPGKDPEVTRDLVFQNLTVADRGEQTEAVNTFVDRDQNSQLLNQVVNEGLSALGIGNNAVRRSRSINLRPFLDQADGGTATRLRRDMPTRPNPRLNPDRFR